MGIAESINRSAPNIDAIAGVVQGIRKRKRDDDLRRQLDPLLYQNQQVIAPDALASLGMNQNEIPIDQEARASMTAGATSGANRPGEFTPQPSQTITQKKFMGVNPDNASQIAELLRMPPEKMIDFLSSVQDKETARKRGNLYPVSRGTDIIDLDTRKPVYSNPESFAPRAEAADKKIDSYIRDDGVRVSVFQKPNGDTYEQEFGKVRPSGSGGGMTDYQRESLKLRQQDAANKPSPEKSRIMKLIDQKTKEAYSIGEEMTQYDSQTLTNPNVVGTDADEFVSPGIDAQYKQRKKAYEDRLSAVNADIERLNALIGGTYRAGDGSTVGNNGSPDQTGAGEGDGFSLEEVRAQYPNLQGRSDDEIIQAYAKQGVTIRP